MDLIEGLLAIVVGAPVAVGFTWAIFSLVRHLKWTGWRIYGIAVPLAGLGGASAELLLANRVGWLAFALRTACVVGCCLGAFYAELASRTKLHKGQ